MPAMFMGTILLPFNTTFGGLDHGFRSQGQCEAKPFGFIFLHAFQLIMIEFDKVLKQFKLNILKLLLSEI